MTISFYFLRYAMLGLALLCAGAGSARSADVPASSHTRTLYLIRHGAYDMSDQQGDETAAYGLTPLGIAQARIMAARLRGFPVTFDTLVSSTFTRARQTADVINQSFPALSHQTDPLLCECRPRTLSEKSDRKVPTDLLDKSDQQLNDAFAKYFVPAPDHDRDDLVVCHGNVIRYLVMKALGVEPKAWIGFSVAHCSLTIIQIRSDGSCQVLAVGDTGHIPPNMLSGIMRDNPELVAPAPAHP